MGLYQVFSITILSEIEETSAPSLAIESEVSSTTTTAPTTTTTEITTTTTLPPTAPLSTELVPTTASILMEILSTSRQDLEDIPSCVTSDSEQNHCVDTHAFYLVIIVGLVISNCILSCLTVQKRL